LTNFLKTDKILLNPKRRGQMPGKAKPAKKAAKPAAKKAAKKPAAKKKK
jgi:hypothetical protein